MIPLFFWAKIDRFPRDVSNKETPHFPWEFYGGAHGKSQKLVPYKTQKKNRTKLLKNRHFPIINMIIP